MPPGAGQGLCGACLTAPPPWRTATCAVDYAFPWDDLVQAFKFANQPELAGLLADAIVRELQRRQPVHDVDMMLPVPLSDRRLKDRGYDQAWELAQALGKSLRIPTLARGLERIVDTVPQSSLDRRARAVNLRGAFRVDPARRDAIAGKRVALVDDVMTTGASFRAATEAVLGAGARSVDVWCVARTP